MITGLKNSFELKELGPVRHYLGIEIEKSSNGEFAISQSKYIDKIVEEADLTNAKISKYPLDPGYFKLDPAPLLPNNDQYRKLIGMLLYLTVNSRPDISASVSILSQKVSKPTVTDLTEVKRVIRYLKGTRDLKLHLGGGDKVELLAYSDANWGEDREDRKSNSGYAISLNGGLISWCCRKQNVIAQSSCEAEYVALNESVREICWLKGLISDFGIKIEKPVTVKTDSQSCIALIRDSKFSNRTKHIDIKYHYVKDMARQDVIELEYVSSEDNVADMMTKPLNSTKISKFRTLVGIQIEEEC